jgi:hypothetical protein
LRKKTFVGGLERFGVVSRLARALPLPVFNLTGSLLYKHIG